MSISATTPASLRMLSVVEAQATILDAVRPRAAELTPLTPAALGLVLAEDVTADVDSPPYDKALMDGYAVRAKDLPEGRGTLTVVEEITAGRTPREKVGPGQASRIMTGAPLPVGADAVIAVEKTRLLGEDRVQVDDRPTRPELNILRRGREMRQGAVVLPAGTLLRPQEFGILATVGRASVRLIPAPRVAILSTGDEIVEAPQVPGPGQIRNGNGPMLQAQVQRAGGIPTYLGIAGDSIDQLRPPIAKGLALDVLVLSGGVSAGKLDLVPEVLQAQGVAAKVHKIAMKPGKPLFFGTLDQDSKRTLVFGLPGNPVSSFACFELFVRLALQALRGRTDPGPTYIQAELEADFPYRTDRPTYHPARVTPHETGWRLRIVPWAGSADLLALTQANALAVLPEGDHVHRAGQRLAALLLDGAND